MNVLKSFSLVVYIHFASLLRRIRLLSQLNLYTQCELGDKSDKSLMSCTRLLDLQLYILLVCKLTSIITDKITIIHFLLTHTTLM